MKKNTGEGKRLENTDDVFGILISCKLKWLFGCFPPSLLPFLNNLLLLIFLFHQTVFLNDFVHSFLSVRLFSFCETLSDDASLLAQEHARSQSR